MKSSEEILVIVNNIRDINNKITKIQDTRNALGTQYDEMGKIVFELEVKLKAKLMDLRSKLDEAI